VDGTGSGLYPMVGFGISSVEPSGSTGTDFVMSQYLINTYLTFATVSIYLQHLCMDLEWVVHANCFFEDFAQTLLQMEKTRNEASIHSQLNNLNC
jgi:hypothetical protein